MKLDNEVGSFGTDLAGEAASASTAKTFDILSVQSAPELTPGDLHGGVRLGNTLPTSAEGPAAHNQRLRAGEVHNTPVPDIKVAPRDGTLPRAERSRGRKLRLGAGAIAILGLGWVAGVNTQSLAIGETTSWLNETAAAFSAATTSIQRGVVEQFDRLTTKQDAVVETRQSSSTAETLEQAVNTLNGKLDGMSASSEVSTQHLNGEVERLRALIERNQGEVGLKLTEFATRIDRLESQAAGPSVASAAHGHEQVSGISPGAGAPPLVQSSSAGGDPAKVLPLPVPPEVRREKVKQDTTSTRRWKVREVLNGMALLEGPRGLVGVSRGQIVPGVGRVESITRHGSRWVVATSNGVIN